MVSAWGRKCVSVSLGKKSHWTAACETAGCEKLPDFMHNQVEATSKINIVIVTVSCMTAHNHEKPMAISTPINARTGAAILFQRIATG